MVWGPGTGGGDGELVLNVGSVSVGDDEKALDIAVMDTQCCECT